MDNKPLVSVLMTSYNREKYIDEAIKSVLCSSYSNLELIIVDDCSSDNTVSIARRIGKSDPRVKVYVNEVNLGQFRNRNLAAKYAKGDYIKYLDSDDVMSPEMLEIIMEVMLLYPSAAFGAQLESIHLNENSSPKIFYPRQAFLNHFFNNSSFMFVGPSGSIYKKSVFELCGGFNEKIGILADTYLSLQIASTFPVVGFKKDLFHWRRHDEQVTVGQENYLQMIKDRFIINRMILDKSDCPLIDYEKKIVLQNQKKIFLRNSFFFLIKLKSFSKLSYLFKMYDIKFYDLFELANRNKKIVE